MYIHIMSRGYFLLALFLCNASVFSTSSTINVLSATYKNNIQKTEFLNGSFPEMYYIYPWGESFYWRFPLDNATCKNAGLQHYMMENSGKITIKIRLYHVPTSRISSLENSTFKDLDDPLTLSLVCTRHGITQCSVVYGIV